MRLVATLLVFQFMGLLISHFQCVLLSALAAPALVLDAHILIDLRRRALLVLARGPYLYINQLSLGVLHLVLREQGLLVLVV